MRAKPSPLLKLLRALSLLVVAVAPCLAQAHERWVKHDAKPFDRQYFESMSGEVLELSLLATAAVAVIIGLWYLGAVVLVERLTPTSVEKKMPRAKRGPIARFVALAIRFALDGYVDSPWLARAETVAVFIFARLPGLVFLLGAWEGWLVMPSFPVAAGPLHDKILLVEVAVALWILLGVWRTALGGAFIAIFVYLCAEYRMAAVDAMPVLASAFFYLFSRPGMTLSAGQVAGIRFGLGVGFIFLGLVNKIYNAQLFIGVGDNYPQLIAGPQSVFPWLTRESWSFATALGEMVFGLFLLLGIFNRITALVLALIFANFIQVFGFAEIVHLYPISGFAVLFFHAAPGTALDGVLFRTHVRVWKAMGYRTSFLLYRASVFVVALTAAAILMFGPLYVTVQVVPRLYR
ncbi:MAG TPA: hypothetical protein VNO55_13020 [Polyangia bacterium]|nr:hypothetical protein [Polyangia bacterium]